MPAIASAPPRLTDSRIALRPVEDHDLGGVLEACQDPDIQRWTLLPSPYTLDAAREFLRLSRDGFATGTGAHLIVVDAVDDRLLGACGLSVSRAHLAATIGYWVAAPVRGRGIATAAVRLVCRWAFDELGLERITLTAAVPNAASNAVARRTGFQFEGRLRRAAVVGRSGDPRAPRVDANVYGLLRGELVEAAP